MDSKENCCRLGCSFPRRNCIDKMTPLELDIRNLILRVEEMGCHTLLTEAITLLGQAQSKVADYVDYEK